MKTAGTSIEVSLASVCGEGDLVTDISLEGLEKGYVHPTNWVWGVSHFRNHAAPKEVYEKIDKSVWDDYHKISVIRNPWDRLVSHWCWRQKNKPPQRWKRWREGQSFSEYLDIRWPDNWRGMDNFSDWLEVNDKICTDFLINFERLDEDFLRLSDVLNIQPIKLPYAKGNVRKSGKPYWEYYNKEEAEVVGKRFKKDIENFGYEFGK